MKRIAFLPSHLEAGQVDLARRMEQNGFRSYWVTHTTYDRHWLARLGVAEERILDTTFRERRGPAEPDIEERLRRIEAQGPPFVNEIIAMDRRLRLKTDAFARRYLAHVERGLSAFLSDHQIEMVVTGRDTALQLVCARVCERLGIASVVPTMVRVPDDRFGFCAGFREDTLVDFRPVADHDLAEARAVLEQFRAERLVPKSSLYERGNARMLNRLHTDFLYWARLSYRASYDIGNDVGRYSVGRLVRMFFKRRLNALHVGLAPVFDPVPDGPFVLYGLQMQPESSIDVLASFVEDQRNLIALIAKSTPRPYEVLVKPHPDHVGGLSRRALAALGRIPGVTLIHPNVPSHDLIRRAAIVMTPTGSMALEAGLYGVPAVIFADEFFKHLPGVHYCRSVTALPALIPQILASPRAASDDRIERYLASILANSFTGRITNYLGPYTEEELTTLVDVYGRLFARLRPSPVTAGDRAGLLQERA